MNRKHKKNAFFAVTYFKRECIHKCYAIYVKCDITAEEMEALCLSGKSACKKNGSLR